MRVLALSVLVVLSSFVIFSHAGEEAVAGKRLFGSTALGSNGKSCSSCHPEGKGLEQIGDYDDAILREFINFCIRDAMKGKMLPEDSKELHALGQYLRNFQKSE